VNEVLSALEDAASEIGSVASRMVGEQPALLLMGALAAGFVVGGGLASPIGGRITTGTLRATFGNLATLVALDLLRRALEEGGRTRGSAESADTGTG
jgi:hypothetical protein